MVSGGLLCLSAFYPCYPQFLPFRDGLRVGDNYSIGTGFLAYQSRSCSLDCGTAICLVLRRNLEPNYTYMAGSKDFSGPRLSGQEYLSLIEDTVFVPCPMGNVHLESFRLYEALDCGCIPIVERRPWLDYFTLLFGEHPLPTVSHWRDAPRLISELNQEGPACLQLKQDEIQDWWRSYREKLSSILENVLQENRDRTSRVQLRWPADTRWRGFIELLQHHNKTALAARAKLTFRRLRRRLVPNAFRHRSQES